MTKKINLFSSTSLLITLKAIVISVILSIPNFIIFYVLSEARPVVARVSQITWLIIVLFLWGYLANRFWNWK